jgi:1,4-dihydroxy-2-naphthoyl-CoA hydrolase
MNHSAWLTLPSLDDINRITKDSMIDFLQIEFIDVGPNHLTARMPITPRVMQPFGIMHGGASATLAETVGSVAAAFCADQKTKACVGLELNINHIRPVKSGFIEAVTTPIHVGKTTQVWDIKIYNEEKKLVSISRLTVAVTDKKE